MSLNPRAPSTIDDLNDFLTTQRARMLQYFMVSLTTFGTILIWDGLALFHSVTGSAYNFLGAYQNGFLSGHSQTKTRTNLFHAVVCQLLTFRSAAWCFSNFSQQMILK